MWDGAFSPNLRKDREPDFDADDSVAVGRAAYEASDTDRFKDKFTIVRVERNVPGEVDVYIKFKNYPKEYLFTFPEQTYQYDKDKVAELVLAELKA